MEPENHTLRLLIEMRAEMRERFDNIEARFEGVDARFDAMDARFDAMDARFDAIDRRLDIVEDIGRDTQAMARMHGRMLRNLLATKRKHADRLDDIERRVGDLERRR